MKKLKSGIRYTSYTVENVDGFKYGQNHVTYIAYII